MFLGRHAIGQWAHDTGVEVDSLECPSRLFFYQRLPAQDLLLQMYSKIVNRSLGDTDILLSSGESIQVEVKPHHLNF